MLILKHLKALQHVSIFIQNIFRELVGSLLKSLNLKIKSVNVLCGEVYLPTQNVTHLHQMLCSRITTFDLLHF